MTEQKLSDIETSDYIAQWPELVARRTRLVVGYTAQAINRVAGTSLTENDIYTGLKSNQPIPEIANLTLRQAGQVVEAMISLKAELREIQERCCYSCGQDLRNGSCPECGPPPF
jgi:hypothetical protein